MILADEQSTKEKLHLAILLEAGELDQNLYHYLMMHTWSNENSFA